MVIALGKAGQQNCKNTHFPALPSAMTVALGKEFSFFFWKTLCRGPVWSGSRQSFFFLKKRKIFAESQPNGLSAKKKAR
jgi:hypothetical protein